MTDFFTALIPDRCTAYANGCFAPDGRNTVGVLRSMVLVFGLALAFSDAAVAQATKPSPPASAGTRSAMAVAPSKSIASRPVWAELTVQQQQALRPLAPGWDTISEAQKRKWLEISKNYPSMTPEVQLTMHSRMTEWVGMSPQARAQARLNFAKTKELSRELTTDEKKAKWQSYQALSAEEKQKLAARATPKPTGAATAVKPVPAQKLAVIPPASASRESNARTLQPSQRGDAAPFDEASSIPATPTPQR